MPQPLREIRLNIKDAEPLLRTYSNHHEFNAIEVFDFTTRPSGLANTIDRNVDIAPQRTLSKRVSSRNATPP